ncbi:MAG: hypothetical protein J6K44_03150 [Clostridia bacterium]|nr:hypothetical protein [Clostridia bacterium]MBP3583018.1 hypothetical protein [Clostridia bacterium]
MKKMKNIKLTKILALALSLALLIGAAVAVAASAETDGSVEFYAQTIVHNDKIAIAYAPEVDITDDATAADGLKVEYKIGESGEWKSATRRNETVEKLDDDGETVLATYPVYATEGMPAQDFTETVYAVAYTGDTRPADSEAKTYSVMQFLYTKLFKDNYIRNTNPTQRGYVYKELYLSLIDYAEKAQIAIDNFDGGKNETLITDYKMIVVENGTIDDTGLSTIISTQNTVTLKYSGELASGAVCTWSVTTYDSEGNASTSEVANNTEIPVTGNMVCSPNVFVPTTYVKGNGKYYLNEDGYYTGKVIDFDNGESAISYTTTGVDPVGELKGDTDKYSYADFTGISAKINTTLTFNSPATADKSFIMEFDAMFEDVDGTFGYFMLCDKINGGDVAGARSSVYLTGSDGKISIHSSNHTILAGENISVKQGEWHNFRFEYAYDSAESLIFVKVYIDNEWKCDIYTNGTATEANSSYRMLIYANKNMSSKLSLDNIYLGYSTETPTITSSAQ